MDFDCLWPIDMSMGGEDVGNFFGLGSPHPRVIAMSSFDPQIGPKSTF